MSKWSITADKFLSQEQIQTLMEHLREKHDLALVRGQIEPIKDFYIVKALLETGLRIAEFCNLKNEDLTGQKLVVKKGKGGKSRTVLLTKGTAIFLKAWVAQKEQLGFSMEASAPMFPSRIGKAASTRTMQLRIRRIFDAARIPSHLSCHSLRHTYCSLLLSSAKVGLPLIRNNMGHSSIAITDLHSHATASISDDVEILPSHNLEKYEARKSSSKKSSIDSVSMFGKKRRKAKFKP